MTKKFLGLQYPLEKTPRGIMAQKSGVDQIKSDLLQLLLTNPGERVMLPEYGTPLRKLMFEQNDITLEIQAKNLISNAITRWEPRIVINAIDISANINKNELDTTDTGDEIGSILMIRIAFVDPQNIQQVEELVLEKPIGGV